MNSHNLYNALSLSGLGWNSFFASHFALKQEEHPGKELIPGRIETVSHGIITIITEHDKKQASLPGTVRQRIAKGEMEYPVTGDWGLIENVQNPGAVPLIDILSRSSSIIRRKPGAETEEQVMAANISTLFIVMGLDRDYSIRRLERYMVIAEAGGIYPVVVLTKTDLNDHWGDQSREITSLYPETPVLPVCAPQGKGLEYVLPFLNSGETVALLGSSGSGKSTLINHLIHLNYSKITPQNAGEEVQKTGELRNDGKGRHTTTSRSFHFLPTGAILIDNPGLREVGLSIGTENIEGGFSEIEKLSGMCKFNDCSHANEPGCAVKDALNRGDISEERYAAYLELKREARVMTPEGQEERKRFFKFISKEMKRYKKGPDKRNV